LFLWKIVKNYGIFRFKILNRSPNVIEPPLTQQVKDTIYDNIRLPAVFIAFKIPKDGEKDFYALDLSQIYWVRVEVHGFIRNLSMRKG